MNTCAACGALNPDGARFCSNCGSPLTAPLDHTPSHERKLVAVLFADVSGSTGLAERLDPEGLRDVLDAYFEVMRPAIEVEGGTVEKYIGDAVMAVFGVPVAHEDDASRALRAALRMRRRLEQLNESLREVHGLTLAMRIGISMGDVVAVTAPVPGTGMVTGDAVNVASRLQEAAGSGQIWVLDRAARAARGVFEFAEIGSLLLKGKERAVHVYELVGEAPDEDRVWPAFSAPMVGREREMALLQTIFERAASEGHPHLVTICGDPGVGKSRLVAEFCSRAADLESAPTVVRGRCLPYGVGVTYSPLAQILKNHAGVRDSDPPDLVVERITAVVKDMLSPDLSTDPERTAAILCLTLGLPHDVFQAHELKPEQLHAEISAAWRAYFSALAGTSPTIAVVEDVHAADGALLDLLEELADQVEGQLIILATARRQRPKRQADWDGGPWNLTRILLEPLASDDVERLIDLALGGSQLPDPVRTKVSQIVGGNPLFIEEITRHLVERGTSRGGNGEGPADGAPVAILAIDEAVEIPDTVQGVLAARMDLLDQLEKRTLQFAAVVGREFWIGPVARLLGVATLEIERTLGGLEDRGLVRARLWSSMAGEREYIFKHVLTRDVAYESLPRRDRSLAHGEVAAWIEEVAGDRWPEFLDLLVHHYGRAYRFAHEQPGATGDQREAYRLAAIRYALAGSDAARGRLVLETAERMAKAALDLDPTPDERSRALEALGETYFLRSDGDEAWANLRDAIDVRLGGQAHDQDTEIAKLCAKALEVATRGRGAMRARLTEAQAAPYLREGLRQLAPGDSEERTRLLTVESLWPYSFRDKTNTEEDLERARRAGEEAAAMASRLGRPDLASAALDGVAASFLSRGLYGPMGQILDRRLKLVPSLTDPGEIGDIYAGAAWAAFHVGRYREAVSFADEGYIHAMPGARLMALYCLDFRSVARCRLGRWDESLHDAALIADLLGPRRDRPPGFASDHLAATAFIHEVRGEVQSAEGMLRILDWLETAEDRPSPGWFAWRALVLSRRGRFAAARELLSRPEAGFQWGLGYRLEALCDVLAEEQAWDDVPAVIEEARRHAQEAGLIALPLYADRLEGSMALALGQTDQARKVLRGARTGFAEIDARWEAARTAVILARAAAEAGDHAEAASEAGRALPVLERLRSVREVEEVRGMLAVLR